MLRGHDCVVIRELSGHTRHIKCRRCEKEYGMNDDLQVVVPWTKEFEDVYYGLLGYERRKR